MQVRVIDEEGGEELQQPLLHHRGAGGEGAGEASQAAPQPAPRGGTCSTAGGVANLVTTAVGAGMVALPRAVSETGILLGMLLFFGTAALTLCSTSIIVRYSSRFSTKSYGELVRLHFGRGGAALLQAAIVTHVGGVMIGYCVIVSDVLVGSAPAFRGVLPTLLGRHDNPWWLSRPAVLAAALCGVVAPMLVPRSLAGVARFSRFGVACVLGLATTICLLAGTAAVEGRLAPDVRLLPDAAAMGGGTPLGMATSILAVVSVSCLAFTCHFNLVPVQCSLKDPSSSHMLRVLQLALAVCVLVYATVAVCGYALFGSETDGDVLKNLTAAAVQRYVPPAAAAAIVYGIAAAFTFNLLVNFVLKVWAVRENLVELALGIPVLRLSRKAFYGLTALLVAAAYGISILVPSIYALLALVGSTACVTFSYFFPAALLWRLHKHPGPRAGAASMVALGAVMAAIAVYDRLRGRGE